MSTHVEHAAFADEVEITRQAIDGYSRLRRALGVAIVLHPARDGGLICEDARRRGRPTIWRIAADGTVTSDSPYNYLLQAFVDARLPANVRA